MVTSVVNALEERELRKSGTRFFSNTSIISGVGAKLRETTTQGIFLATMVSITFFVWQRIALEKSPFRSTEKLYSFVGKIFKISSNCKSSIGLRFFLGSYFFPMIFQNLPAASIIVRHNPQKNSRTAILSTIYLDSAGDEEDGLILSIGSKIIL